LVRAAKIDSETAYEKIDFFQSNKRRILSLAASPAKLARFPTKRNPVPIRALHIRVFGQRAQTRHVTVDDIDSFRKLRGVRNAVSEIGDDYSEQDFKLGMQRIIGEGGRFKDWGGEVADLFTTKCRLDGRRRPVALALKGPGTKGKLTPGKMGKNGDQVQRLFEAPAEAFLVQYCRQIEPSVLTQMKQLAIVKSLMTGTRIFYGVIDGNDSRRLVTAYPHAFTSTRSRRAKKRRA
jgi:hypothetical protein